MITRMRKKIGTHVKVKIEFGVDNDTFITDDGELSLEEVALMIKDAGTKVHNQVVIGNHNGRIQLVDSNGNRVGYASIQIKE